MDGLGLGSGLGSRLGLGLGSGDIMDLVARMDALEGWTRSYIHGCNMHACIRTHIHTYTHAHPRTRTHIHTCTGSEDGRGRRLHGATPRLVHAGGCACVHVPHPRLIAACPQVGGLRRVHVCICICARAYMHALGLHVARFGIVP